SETCRLVSWYLEYYLQLIREPPHLDWCSSSPGAAHPFQPFLDRYYPSLSSFIWHSVDERERARLGCGRWEFALQVDGFEEADGRGANPGQNYLLATQPRYGEITLNNGRVERTSFDTRQIMRMNEAPAIEVYIVPSEEPPGGMGECGCPVSKVLNATITLDAKLI